MSEQRNSTEQWGIYNRIRELRRAKGVSQKELAKQLELNHRSVEDIERQDYEPSLRLAWWAADYFGVTLDDVFYRSEGPLAAEPSQLEDKRGSEASPQAQTDETTRGLQERPQARKVLTTLLDQDRAELEGLVRRTHLDVAELGHEMIFLQDQGLVEESTQPGPVFGRPHRTVFSLTEEGHRRIVEIHRSL